MQGEHLIDEGRADAERLSDFADGAVAAQGRGSARLDAARYKLVTGRFTYGRRSSCEDIQARGEGLEYVAKR
jgi:hypothetical protein